MYTTYCWSARHHPGFEHCAVSFDDGLRADGVVVGVDDGDAFRLRYRVETDEQYRTRRVSIDPLAAGLDADRPATTRDASRTLTADGDGAWTVDGEDAPELDGCLDVDVAVTPFTNVLPVRRLDLETGASATLDVVYLDPLGGELTATRQRYTHLERVETGSRYRYEGLDSGFTAELVVDEEGVVTDYPGLFALVD